MAEQQKIVKKSGKEKKAGPGEQPDAPPLLDGMSLPLTTYDGERRYQICDQLGYGGAAVVYIGLDRDLNRQVAVKILRRELNQSRDAVGRFLNEAQITARLQHPGIVPIYEIGLLNRNRLFFAMERVEGKTLRTILDEWAAKEEGHTLEGLLRIYEQVCQIVAYAHSVSVAHRDLKPENIMIGEFNKVYVMDWGIAKNFNEPAPPPAPARQEQGDLAKTFTHNLTMPGSMKGTPNYMSPEQVLGIVQRVDYRSDVFSLGIILYEILAGRHPYRRDDMRATLHAIKHYTPSTPRTPFGFREYASICMRALCKLPDQRYANAGELAADMRGALEHRPISVHHDSLFHHYFKFARRHRVLTIFLLAFMIFLSGILAVAWRENRDWTQLLSMSRDRLASVQHYQRRVTALQAALNGASGGLKQQIQRLMTELKQQEVANRVAARALLTVAWRKNGASALSPALLRQLKQLWLIELEEEIKRGNLDGAAHIFKELAAALTDPTFNWTPGELARIRQIRQVLRSRLGKN